MIRRLLIAGGKTGGHLYPGIAVAEEVLARNPDAHITFVGTQDGIESRVLPKLGYTLETITVSRLKGSGVAGRLIGLARVPIALMQSISLLWRLRPQAVLGVGGYASGPALLAAWLCRYPTAIQEQNATPGLTNRILGRLVATVYLGFDRAGEAFKGRRTVPTGNPIRRALIDALEASNAQRTAEEDRETVYILVFGGSQGARFLNEHVPGLLEHVHQALPELDLRVVHQTGRHDEQTTRDRYEATALAGRVEVVSYIDDMPVAYQRASLGICRAGALTTAELTAAGLPSLLVPFPFAADNHQEANAQVLVEHGAARMVRQAEWSVEALSAWLADLLSSPSKRQEMSRKARGLARPSAATILVDDLERLVSPPKKEAA